MKEYIGTKIVKAEPEIRGNEEQGYKVQYEDGYVSWTPKETFEKAYQQVDEGMTFEHALFLAKQGKSILRKGWNGKNLGVCIVTDEVDVKGFKIEPFFVIVNYTTNKTNTWVPSVSDLLATDWIAV